jgi:hypothetical protein
MLLAELQPSPLLYLLIKSLADVTPPDITESPLQVTALAFEPEITAMIDKAVNKVHTLQPPSLKNIDNLATQIYGFCCLK